MSGSISTVPPRLDGVFNFRDLGGLPLTGGGATAPGRLFRSDGLHRAPVDQQTRLREVPVASVVDLRTEAEIEREGRVRAEGIAWHHSPIFQSLSDFVGAGPADDDLDLLCHHFEHMLEVNAQPMVDALGVVAESVEAGPTVFHCTAGKDRTGVMAALILGGLGVDDDAVSADFARSADGISKMVDWYRRTTGGGPADRLAEMGIDPALAPIILGARSETMETFLARMRSIHGGVGPYLRSIGAHGAVDRIGRALVA